MPPNVVDRQREIEQLQGLAAAPPALVVLTGRRRIGKSFLLRVALAGDRVVSFQAEQQPRSLQLAAFARECGRLVADAPLAFERWEDGLAFLDARARSDGPLTVVLDEFQYLADQDEGLVSAIQKRWDRWDHERVPILLVLSGSALSFMSGLLTGDRPTHGRSGYRPVLGPLGYEDTAAFAPTGAPADELIERYAVLGGTPQYQRWAGPRPLGSVLREIILAPDGPLHRDPEHLVREEDDIREAGPYFGVLEAIAGGYSTPVKMAGRLGIGTPLLTPYLKRLRELGYVARVEPVEPKAAARRRAYWKVSDPYFRFWFRYVLPNRSRLARGRIEEVAAEIEAQLPGYVGLIFEDVCRDWLGRISPLGAGAREVGSWWDRTSTVEIDVAAVDTKGYTVLGACKWSARPVGESVLDELVDAQAMVGPKASRATLALFSRSRFTRELQARASRESVELVTVDDLFA